MKIMTAKKGFTLIELLVVISIIALLISILLPALGKARNMAKDVMCRTNLKSMHLAAFMYADDSEGRMMQYSTGEGLWLNQISRYMENVDEVRYCPMTRIEEVPDDFSDPYLFGNAKEAWMWSWGVPEFEYGSYGINGWFYHFSDSQIAGRESEVPGFGDKLYKNFQSLKNPQRAPIFADSVWIDGWPEDTDVCYDDFDLDGNPNYGGQMSRYLLNRHGPRTNIAFVDGHQESVELNMLWTLRWNRQFQNMGKMTRTPSGDPIYQRK